MPENFPEKKLIPICLNSSRPLPEAGPGRKARATGSFTLVEFLIALSIFGIIVVSLYSAFRTGLSSYRKIDSAFTVSQTARSILNRMELELKNAFPLYKNKVNIEGTNNKLSFFCQAETFQKSRRMWQIRRLQYETGPGIFTRRCFSGLDGLFRNPVSVESEFPPEVSGLSFEYAASPSQGSSSYLEWLSQWPKKNDMNQSALPLAIKVRLTILDNNDGKNKAHEFTRLITIPWSENLSMIASP